ncbi:hypothetical protein ASPWEDRAFT_43224 [Aspergillus wentii DTO 134E9]|uniref:Uncharacterized protein n=1 Tax=Aspergillus wentii DTO 134E9 TaxID=1073089 RepID=A0A1L9RE06_ASPWE|nr:uncharacterized protein ASPWEDRAFT_43224 [Aspergillus wentii DTO 134E9]OJJ33152.1 hypothetical protein ASPWEDRAFT_43224 [Aspergillus wentii DTO 134E9]
MGIKSGRLSSSSWVVAGRVSRLQRKKSRSILGGTFFGVANRAEPQPRLASPSLFAGFGKAPKPFVSTVPFIFGS